ncbi:MAG: rhomboid family intramembrane serine protease [Akkermansiaceae bacterium]|jgi:rhomboid protease GluP|nr:rhomboid family intramembrane serine protease [Akkermansiaceae bacterium]
MPEEPQTDPPEETWVGVGTYPTLDAAYDHALVALAMGESIRVEHSTQPGEYDLQAVPEAVPKITSEIAQYTEEAHIPLNPPLLPSNWGRHPAGILPLFIWVTTLIFVFTQQLENPSINENFASSSIALITHGEWWRPFTALFLHGDASHIIGNLATGAVFGMLVSKSIGPWKGWALILLSGTAGNAITSLVTYPENFTSLGASTAVFGALGILSGTGLVENLRENIAHPWIRTLAPVIAGFVLLGWLGGAAPGSNTDVFGHVFGFAAGVFTGATCLYLEKPPQEPIETLHQA